MVRWGLTGLLIAFGVLAIFSVGLPFLLAGVLMAVFAAARGDTNGAVPGLALGIGAACVFLLATGFGQAIGLVVAVSLGWSAAAVGVGLLAGRAGRLASRRG